MSIVIFTCQLPKNCQFRFVPGGGRTYAGFFSSLAASSFFLSASSFNNNSVVISGSSSSFQIYRQIYRQIDGCSVVNPYPFHYGGSAKVGKIEENSNKIDQNYKNIRQFTKRESKIVGNHKRGRLHKRKAHSSLQFWLILTITYSPRFPLPCCSRFQVWVQFFSW